MSDYTRIYLQPECCADPDMGRLWCQDDEPETCPDGEKWTPYVLASELAKKQADLDRALARVAELESRLEGIANCAFGYTGCRQTAEEAASWMNGEAMRLLGDPQPSAWLLRKQAEAVESFLSQQAPLLDRYRPHISKSEREHTPPLLAEWLVELAGKCSHNISLKEARNENPS